MSRPTNSASAKSRSATRAEQRSCPTTSSEPTGSSATIDVFIERISTWFSDRFTIVE